MGNENAVLKKEEQSKNNILVLDMTQDKFQATILA